MGTAYKIRCRHCGAQFEHHMQPGYGVLPVCVGCGEYVETETAIRCPACHKKLNTTQEEFNEQIEVVNRTLSEIDKTEKPMIMVFNKIDAFTFVPKDEDDLTPRTRENIDLDELKRTWMNKMQDNCIFISAKERTNIDALKALLYERVKQIHITRFPYNDFLFQQYDEE